MYKTTKFYEKVNFTTYHSIPVDKHMGREGGAANLLLQLLYVYSSKILHEGTAESRIEHSATTLTLPTHIGVIVFP